MASNVTRDHHNLRRNLKLNGNYISNDGGDEGISIADDGDVTVGSLITNNISPAGQLTIDAAGDIILDAGADDVDFKTHGDLFAKFNSESTGSTTSLTLYEEGGGGSGSADYLKINVAEHGATTISTVDDAGADDAHLTLDVDGNIILDADAGYTYIDNDGTRHGYLSAFSSTKLILGATTNYDLKLATSGTGDIIIDSSGHVEFDGCAVGFDKLAGAFGTSQVLDDPNDSTDIDFRLSNKYELELTNIIAGAASSEFLNLIFPAVSGNFILVISQDGTGGRTIHPSAWVAYQSDGSTKATNVAFANGTDGAIRWAGGSATPLTTTADKADIVSIYWDADNETAFAVVSQNF